MYAGLLVGGQRADVRLLRLPDDDCDGCVAGAVSGFCTDSTCGSFCRSSTVSDIWEPREVSGLVLVVQDDLAAVAAGRRVVLLQDVQALRGLHAREVEVVGVVAAVGPVQDLECREGDQPGDDDDDEVPGAPLAEPPQPARRGLGRVFPTGTT